MIEKQLTNTASLALVKVHLRKRDRELRKLGCFSLPLTENQLITSTQIRAKQISLPRSVAPLVTGSVTASARLLEQVDKRVPRTDASVLKQLDL